MIIQTKELVPRPYRQSRDYQVLLKLLELLIVPLKNDVDNFVGYINAEKCPSAYLPLLASMVGYKYDYNLSYEENRIIIQNYPTLVTLRGSEAGIEAAVAVSIKLQGNYEPIKYIKNLVNIEYIKAADGKHIDRLDVYYYPNYLPKVYDLIEVVRPVGLGIRLIPSNALHNPDDDTIEFTVKARHIEGNVDATDRYKVSNKNETGFGEVEKMENYSSDEESEE